MPMTYCTTTIMAEKQEYTSLYLRTMKLAITVILIDLIGCRYIRQNISLYLSLSQFQQGISTYYWLLSSCHLLLTIRAINMTLISAPQPLRFGSEEVLRICSQRMNCSLNTDKDVCRTAPATPCLGHMTRDRWHMTCYMWHVTHGGGWIFSKNINCHTVFVWRCFWVTWNKRWPTELII